MLKLYHVVSMKKWESLNELRTESGELRTDHLIDLLLANRGITTAKAKEAFLHPKLEDVTPKSVGIDTKQLTKALKRINQAIERKEQIIVFGDYDVDGITGAAILWETLHKIGARAMPYIPHRVDEGYGLSIKGLINLRSQFSDLTLVITVDNGIVAHDAVTFANKQGMDVIITDHHAASEKQPDAYAIVHTTNLCGAGVAYLLSKELSKSPQPPLIKREKGNPPLVKEGKVDLDTHLELATLGTVADMVPLTGANRAIVAHGLQYVCDSKRPGLRALYEQAGLDKETFTPYDIGFVIAPRLNAAGRIEDAMDSLRLLCTNRRDKAQDLAVQLELTNKERQHLMKTAAEHAITSMQDQQDKKILIAIHESYKEGVIGLVAGKLVEAYYRPAIVIAKRETHSKASVRSIAGFNIIEFLRLHVDQFVNVGGHPMAAGFTVETAKLESLKQALEEKAEELLAKDLLTRTLKIDCELPLYAVTLPLYKELQQLGPFGMGNPEPVFMTKDVIVGEMKTMGKEHQHLRLKLQQNSSPSSAPCLARLDSDESKRAGRQVSSQFIEAVAFGMGELAKTISIGDSVDIAYVIDENTWNGTTKLQLKIKDITV